MDQVWVLQLSYHNPDAPDGYEIISGGWFNFSSGAGITIDQGVQYLGAYIGTGSMQMTIMTLWEDTVYSTI